MTFLPSVLIVLFPVLGNMVSDLIFLSKALLFLMQTVFLFCSLDSLDIITTSFPQVIACNEEGLSVTHKQRLVEIMTYHVKEMTF